jgi:hypothetical protein
MVLPGLAVFPFDRWGHRTAVCGRARSSNRIHTEINGTDSIPAKATEELTR